MRRTDTAQTAVAPLPRGIRPLIAAAMLVLVAFASPNASAQLVSLDPEIPRSVVIAPNQESAIDDFIAEFADDAFGTDRAAAARALDELIDPLLSEGVSVSFRQTYSRKLADRIEAALTDQPVMLEGENGEQSINHLPFHALRLAGEIATDQTLNLIIPVLSSDDAGRRYFAIHSVETVLFRMRTASAVGPRTLLNRRQGEADRGLLPDLGKMLAEEPSGRHAAAIVRALAEAAELPSDALPDAQNSALALIGNGVSARIRNRENRAPSFEETLAWLTAGQRIVRRIAQPGSTDSTASLASIRLGGQLVASVFRDLEAGRVVPSGERENNPDAAVHTQLLGLAENLILFGEQNLASATNRAPNTELIRIAEGLDEAFKAGRDTELRRAALQLISPNGLLTDQPYRFTDDEFLVE